MTNTARAELDLAKLVKKPDNITAEDVLKLRREIFGDGVVTRAEAEAIFAIDQMMDERCPEWIEFFVEALTDHLVDQVEPRGYVLDEDARWLLEMVSTDGKVESSTELELLVRVLVKAQRVPERLEKNVLDTIGRAVLAGEGPLAGGGALTPGVIGEAEVELVRQVLFACGGEGGISITKSEAEFLFMLNERTDDSKNHPAWRELYVKAIANYLMAAATYRALPRAQALAREEWLDDSKVDVAGFLSKTLTGFGSIFSSGFSGVLFESSHEQIERAWKARNRAQSTAEADAERITDDEAKWLLDKLMQDGLVDENEKALLARLFGTGKPVNQELKPLVEDLAS